MVFVDKRLLHAFKNSIFKRLPDFRLSNASPGKKHDMAKHPNKPGIKIPLPRHKEINEYTAQGILEQAGLK